MIRKVTIEIGFNDQTLAQDKRGLRATMLELFVSQAKEAAAEIYHKLGFGHGTGTMPETVRPLTKEDLVPGTCVWRKGPETCHFHVVDHIYDEGAYFGSDGEYYDIENKFVIPDDGLKIGMVVSSKPVTAMPTCKDDLDDLWVVHSGEYGNYFVGCKGQPHSNVIRTKLDTGITEKCYPMRFLMIKDLADGYYPAIHQPTGQVGTVIHRGESLTFEPEGGDDAMAIETEHDEFVSYLPEAKYAHFQQLYKPIPAGQDIWESRND